MKTGQVILIILFCHVDTLLGNDHEVSNYTTAVTRMWPLFLAHSAQICCKQQRLGDAAT
jgi:hypothetical protein